MGRHCSVSIQKYGLVSCIYLLCISDIPYFVIQSFNFCFFLMFYPLPVTHADNAPQLSTHHPRSQFVWKQSFWICSVTFLYLIVSITTEHYSFFPLEGLDRLWQKRSSINNPTSITHGELRTVDHLLSFLIYRGTVFKL